MIETFIGMEYNRSLMMLQEYAEDGKVNSELTVKDIENYDGCKYFSIDSSYTNCNISDLIKEDYTRLLEYMNGNHQESMSGPSFSIYKKLDPVKGIVECTACTSYFSRHSRFRVWNVY